MPAVPLRDDYDTADLRALARRVRNPSTFFVHREDPIVPAYSRNGGRSMTNNPNPIEISGAAQPLAVSVADAVRPGRHRPEGALRGDLHRRPAQPESRPVAAPPPRQGWPIVSAPQTAWRPVTGADRLAGSKDLTDTTSLQRLPIRANGAQ